nr:hypothetical protein Ade03nite_12710 [Actinoplanes derwentensis]
MTNAHSPPTCPNAIDHQPTARSRTHPVPKAAAWPEARPARGRRPARGHGPARGTARLGPDHRGPPLFKSWVTARSGGTGCSFARALPKVNEV